MPELHQHLSPENSCVEMLTVVLMLESAAVQLYKDAMYVFPQIWEYCPKMGTGAVRPSLARETDKVRRQVRNDQVTSQKAPLVEQQHVHLMEN